MATSRSHFSIESVGVSQEGGRAAEDLGVPRPAHALVPLGAVRGNVQEIAPQAPFDVAFQPVQERIGTGKTTGLRHIGMNYAGGEIFFSDFLRPGFNQGVAKALEGKAFVIGSGLVIPADIPDFRQRAAKIVKVRVARCVQCFKAAKMRQSSRLSLYGKPYMARQILPKIQHRFAFGGGQNLTHRQFAQDFRPGGGLGR